MNTMMNVDWTKDKDKDKLRLDMEEYYSCPKLNLQQLRDGH